MSIKPRQEFLIQFCRSDQVALGILKVTVAVRSPLQHNKQLWHIVEKKLLNIEGDR
jgi:hypothetical protein